LSFGLGMSAPVSAVHLLWLNLVIDGLPDTALIFEPRENTDDQTGPDGQKLYLLNRSMIWRMLLLGVWIGVTSFGLFVWATQVGDLAYAQTMVLTQLVVFQLINSLNCQSTTRSMFTTWIGNRFLIVSIVGGLAAHLLILYLPIGQELFGLVPLSLDDWGRILVMGTTLIGLEEGRKWLVRHGMIASLRPQMAPAP
jgi:Ca2+-transporting ATPase